MEQQDGWDADDNVWTLRYKGPDTSTRETDIKAIKVFTMYSVLIYESQEPLIIFPVVSSCAYVPLSSPVDSFLIINMRHIRTLTRWAIV